MKVHELIANLHDVDPEGKVLGAIRLLLSTLSLEEQRRAIQELSREVQPIAAPRAGAVLGTIIEWMPRQSAWTVNEAKLAIAARGVDASPKEIYNAIAYLNRKGRVKRISYGHYVVDGYGGTQKPIAECRRFTEGGDMMITDAPDPEA